MVVLAAACGSEPASRSRADAIRSTATAVPFTGCDKVACTGTLSGAKYEIELPRTWNGTLLLFSHGYRPAEPAPPDFAPVQTDAQDAPTDAVATALLAKGYALAGSAYATNGWAVADGVAAGEQLHDFFVQKIGQPDRTYVWGESLGGLITEMLAEKHPDWIAGAAPLCGVLGGTNLNFDLAMDLAYGVKTLLAPGLKTDGYASYDDGDGELRAGARRRCSRPTGSSAGLGKLLLLAALVDAPTQTASYDGSTLQSRGGALVEGILTGLAFGTTVRQELERPGRRQPVRQRGRGLRRPGLGGRAGADRDASRPARPRPTWPCWPTAAGSRRTPPRGRSSPALGHADRRHQGADADPAHRGRPAGAGAERVGVRRQGRGVDGEDRGPGAALHEGAGHATPSPRRTGPGTATSPPPS